MPLTVTDINEILEGKKGKDNKVAIGKAILHEERVRFHSEATIDENGINGAYKNFMKMVGELLPTDKVNMFKVLFQFPVVTVPLMDEVYVALSKLFDGRNPVTTYDFLNKEYEEDWREYKEQSLSEKFWGEKGFDLMKGGINSLVVVDLPEEQDGERPEPYIYFVSLKDVVALESKNGVDIDWVIFNREDGKLGVFDDSFYRVFEVEEGNKKVSEAEIENEHDLGFCPVRFFWTSSVNDKEPIVKKSPISSFLGKLDMLAFYEVGNEHLNLFGRYPIYSAYVEDCNYENRDNGQYCDKGFLVDRSGQYILDGTVARQCPKCSKKKLVGAGSLIEVEPPTKMNGGIDLGEPVKITSIPKESLDYNNEDIRMRRMEIYKAITGFNGMSINDKAVNEKQVSAIFESLEAALKMPQMNFERVIEWVEDVVCKLRYGSEIFKGVSVSLGTEHYIMSSKELLDLYLSHKEKGAPFGVLDMWEDRYYESEYKNDPLKMRRYNVLKNLDPLRHIDNKTAFEMCESQKISTEVYLLKSNLSSLVLRFERDNGLSVVDFGANIDFGKKIEIIKKSLLAYAKEMENKVIV